MQKLENTLTLEKSVPSLLLIVCLVGLPQLSETIYSPALPAVTQGLQTTSHLVQWTLSIYFIGFAAGVALWGKLSDHYGRKPIMLLGIALYLIFSFLCSSAHSISTLLFARFFQAFGISVGSVITQAIMRDCFSGVRRHQIFSITGMAIGLAPALGPIIGGYLTEQFSWRTNFSCLCVLGSFLFWYAFVKLPETYQYIDASQQQSLSYTYLLKKMLSDKHIQATTLLVGGFNGILFGYYSAAPYIFIDLYHLSEQNFGLLGFFMATGVCLGSLLSHRLNKFINIFKLIKLSVTGNVVAMAIFLLLVYIGIINTSNKPLSIFLIMSCMMSFYICFGIGIPNILSKALVRYQANIGAAGSILGLLYYIWVGIFVFGIGALIPNSLYVMPGYFLLLATLMFIASFFLVKHAE